MEDKSKQNSSLQKNDSSIQKPERPLTISTTRLLYLRNELASNLNQAIGVPMKAVMRYTPYHLIWALPPIHDTRTNFQITLRNLDIDHIWPNVRTNYDLDITNTSTGASLVATIPWGNYTPDTLASTISSLLAAIGITVTFDSKQQLLKFTPSVTINPVLTTAWEIIGLNPSIPHVAITQADLPPSFKETYRLHLNTNLSLYTIPPSGRLSTVQVSSPFGSRITYFDESGTAPSLDMDHNLSTLEIHIQDQNNNSLFPLPLTGINDTIFWGAVIAITPIPNDAYEDALDLMKD